MKLKELQHWMGRLIAHPLQENQLLPATICCDVPQFIAPSRTLEPFQRIQIYHQQYWWRLIKCLQTNFPTLLRLFGYEDFQTLIAVPYLSAHPPGHWALSTLGESLPEWIELNYSHSDKYLVKKVSEIDWAAGKAFWIQEAPTVPFTDLAEEEMMSTPLTLQPYVSLFELKADFFSFRDEFLKNEPHHYNANPFPSMTYGYFTFMLYRTPKNVVKWSQISPAEYWMLTQFKTENTIERVCADLEERGADFRRGPFKHSTMV